MQHSNRTTSLREKLRERHGVTPTLADTFFSQKQLIATRREVALFYDEPKPKTLRKSDLVTTSDPADARCRECGKPFVKIRRTHVMCGDPECEKQHEARRKAAWKQRRKEKPKANYTSPAIEAERAANASRNMGVAS